MPERRCFGLGETSLSRTQIAALWRGVIPPLHRPSAYFGRATGQARTSTISVFDGRLDAQAKSSEFVVKRHPQEKRQVSACLGLSTPRAQKTIAIHSFTQLRRRKG